VVSFYSIWYVEEFSKTWTNSDHQKWSEYDVEKHGNELPNFAEVF